MDWRIVKYEVTICLFVIGDASVKLWQKLDSESLERSNAQLNKMLEHNVIMDMMHLSSHQMLFVFD